LPARTPEAIHVGHVKLFTQAVGGIATGVPIRAMGGE
jgi:hypothetical protein